jgi:hypothetical protein
MKVTAKQYELLKALEEDAYTSACYSVFSIKNLKLGRSIAGLVKAGILIAPENFEENTSGRSRSLIPYGSYQLAVSFDDLEPLAEDFITPNKKQKKISTPKNSGLTKSEVELIYCWFFGGCYNNGAVSNVGIFSWNVRDFIFSRGRGGPNRQTYKALQKRDIWLESEDLNFKNFLDWEKVSKTNFEEVLEKSFPEKFVLFEKACNWVKSHKPGQLFFSMRRVEAGWRFLPVIFVGAGKNYDITKFLVPTGESWSNKNPTKFTELNQSFMDFYKNSITAHRFGSSTQSTSEKISKSIEYYRGHLRSNTIRPEVYCYTNTFLDLFGTNNVFITLDFFRSLPLEIQEEFNMAYIRD